MKWILFIILSSLSAGTGALAPLEKGGKTPISMTLEKNTVEIFTEEGDRKVLSTLPKEVEKEFVSRGGKSEPIRKLDLKTGILVGYPIPFKRILENRKVALISSSGELSPTLAWQVWNNAGHHNLWAPMGIKNGIDTLIPLSYEIGEKIRHLEFEDEDFKDLKKEIPDLTVDRKETSPIFTDRDGYQYTRVSQIGENWIEQFNPELIIHGEINKDVLVDRNILRERLEHEYYIPIIQNKNAVIVFDEEAYQATLLRLTEVSIKYGLSFDGVQVIPLFIEDLENGAHTEKELQQYVDFLHKSL